MKKKIFALLLAAVIVTLAVSAFATAGTPGGTPGGMAGGTAGGMTGGTTGGAVDGSMGGMIGGSGGVGDSSRDGFASGEMGDAGDTVDPENSIPGNQTGTTDSLEDDAGDGDTNNRTNWGGIVIAILLAIGLIAVVVAVVPKRRR